MECNLVWNHTRDFKIERARSGSSIWNHEYAFRPKLHSTQFSYHFIKSILKSHNFMALNFDFGVMFEAGRFVRNSRIGNALTSYYLVCKTMSCDENSFKHDEQTSSSEVRTITVSFMHQSSILVAWINDGRPLWLRLRLPVVFGEGIWSTAGAILRWASFELWNSLDCTMPSCGEFSLLNTVQWHSIWF